MASSGKVELEMLGKAMGCAFASSLAFFRGKGPTKIPGNFSGVLMGLLLAALSLSAAEKESDPLPTAQSDPVPTPVILELRDSALIVKVWNLVYPDSAVPGGEFQILLPYGPDLLPDKQDPTGDAYLLRNGTQIGRMDRTAWQQFGSAAQREDEDAWSSSSDGANREEVPILWKAIQWNRETLLAWTEWPAGLLVGIGSSISAVPASKPQYQRDIDFDLSQKIFRHYLLGLELHRSQFGGGLTRMALEAEAVGGGFTGRPVTSRPEDISFWGDGYWWWAASVGVPGLKYTLALANQPLPKYYWLDPSATTAVKERRSGQIVNQWTGPSLERDGNFSHTLDARLGYLRYGFHFDTDAYRFPVQTIGMDELQAPFGTWGGGLLMASDILATRIWFDIPDLASTLPFPRAYPSDFRLAFLHLEFAYRNIRSFNLGVSVRIHVDNPILNRSGA